MKFQQNLSELLLILIPRMLQIICTSLNVVERLKFNFIPVDTLKETSEEKKEPG
jgi:hypothetical protein